MIPSYWYTPAVAFLWQVALHSALAASVFAAWSRRAGLPSGRVRRWMLCLLLVLPVITAAVPGRYSFDFREQVAWLDSVRVLAVPLVGPLHVYHVVLLAALLTVAATVWQELVPVFSPPKADFSNAPEDLRRRVRELPGWDRCRVGILPDEHIVLATSGRPSQPRLMVSTGALRSLGEAELESVLRHENAHWRRGRWFYTHLFFLLRLLQCYNPVALWAFREYSIEVEVDCDGDAVDGNNYKPLARALMKVYESTDHGDYGARSILRARVDALVARPNAGEEPLRLESVVAAALVLLVLLPWIV